MSTQVKRTAEDFAKNLPTITEDGFHGPIRITSENVFNGKRIVNLACKTLRSGEKNATISWPSHFTNFTKFANSKGRLVDLVVVDGYVKSIEFSRPKPVSAVKTADVTAEQEEALANEADMMDEALALTKDQE